MFFFESQIPWRFVVCSSYLFTYCSNVKTTMTSNRPMVPSVSWEFELTREKRNAKVTIPWTIHRPQKCAVKKTRSCLPLTGIFTSLVVCSTLPGAYYLTSYPQELYLGKVCCIDRCMMWLWPGSRSHMMPVSHHAYLTPSSNIEFLHIFIIGQR